MQSSGAQPGYFRAYRAQGDICEVQVRLACLLPSRGGLDLAILEYSAYARTAT